MLTLLAAAVLCGTVAVWVLLGGGAVRSTANQNRVPAEASSASGAISCVTGIQLVEFVFAGPNAHHACADLHYHLIRAFGRSGPSLEPEAYANENQFARRGRDTVSVIETGSDNSEINDLAAGVLLGDGYRVHFGTWTSFQVP